MPQRELVEQAAASLLDPQGRTLAAAVQWWELPGWPEAWPVAVVGQGPPLLLLHGFDSSHLEYRRLAPLLSSHHQLFIPDLFGFGFCPRPSNAAFNPGAVLTHLEVLLQHVLQVKVTRWISTHRIILKARTINRRACVLRLVRYAWACG